MAVRQVLGVVGAVVGGYIGGPQGAQYGWMIGSAIGSTVDPLIIKGPTVGDIANQTSQEGVPRPIVFKLSAPMPGNIIATGPPKKVKKRKSQGKGGPKVETETILRTYAIGVCEGPIGSFVRVWRNGELVYDAGAPVTYLDEDGQVMEAVRLALRITLNNEAWAEKVTYHLGTFDQGPAPALEAIFGVGTTPSHRGTAYMVVEDDDLTDLRGAIPQYVFQVDQTGADDFTTTYTVNDTWEKPAALESAEVHVYGAGAGGASGSGAGGVGGQIGGDAGGGGGYSLDEFDAADLPDTVAVTVGVGGAGATAELNLPSNTRTAGEDGGASSFGALLSADGGKGGVQSGDGSEGGIGTTENGSDGALGGAIGQFPENALSRAFAGGGGGGGGGIEINGTPQDGSDGGSSSTGDPQISGGGTGGIRGNQFDPPIGMPGGSGNNNGEHGGGGGGGGGAGGALGVDPNLIESSGGDGERGATPGGGGGGGGATQIGTGLVNQWFPGDGGEGGDGLVVVVHRMSDTPVTLQSVVSALAGRAGLPPELIDVSDLEGFVRGFTVINSYPCSAALQALSQIYLFDEASIDGKVTFFHRGHNSVATIVEEEMLDDENEIEQTKRGDPISVPRVMNLNYHDIAGGISTDKQTSERAGDRRAIGEVQLQTAVILTSDEAAQAVRINHKVMVEDLRGEIKFCLPDKWIGLTPGDITVVQWQGRSERVRLTSVAVQDGFQEYMALRDRQSAYQSNVEGIPAAPILVPPSNVVGPTLIQPLDIHILRDVDDGMGLSFYVAVAGIGDAWTGALIELSYDGGANYVDSETTSISSTMGELLATLPDHPAEFPDEINTLRVRIDTPDAELQSADLEALLNRANLAIVGDEIIQFGNAEEVDPGEWELSYLIRGRKGTDAIEHPVGARFVLLDAFTPIPASITDIGRTMTFRATSFGTPSDSGTVLSMVYVGRSQTEREVGYLAAHRDGSNAVVSWQGVGRLGSGASAVHGARFAGYRVTFDDGILAAVVVDTALETLTQDVSALGAPLTISVVQLNDLTGAGPSTEVILS